ncbi:unnamed protein product [Enterobius vermicularis]|uniref:PABS domain-containing protein n=1 Tax=Enterobius vermicularis TaxID=51028 RepID=A0A0N4VPJ2_ENTVE|nr:unnamed protein product [Enterobius vermicularis]
MVHRFGFLFRAVIIRELGLVDIPNLVLSIVKLKWGKRGSSNAPTKDWKMDYMYVPSRYLKESLSLIFATNILQTNTADRTFLSIGLGAGAVNGFIHEKLKDVNIKIVEIDPAILNVAKKYFSYADDDTQQCIIKDGKIFLQESVQNGLCFAFFFLLY